MSGPNPEKIPCTSRGSSEVSREESRAGRHSGKALQGNGAVEGTRQTQTKIYKICNRLACCTQAPRMLIIAFTLRISLAELRLACDHRRHGVFVDLIPSRGCLLRRRVLSVESFVSWALYRAFVKECFHPRQTIEPRRRTRTTGPVLTGKKNTLPDCQAVGRAESLSAQTMCTTDATLFISVGC